MEKLRNFGDKRQTQSCVYCGEAIETREHVPSRVFLDEPYPKDLPTVGACRKCNQKHSLDEEYVACLVECAKIGSTDPNAVQRDKVRNILSKKPALAERLQRAMVLSSGFTAFKFESNRVKSVFLKLAQGHLLFEQNEPLREDPIWMEFGILETLTKKERNFFENSPEINYSPEVGSRSTQRMLISAGKVQMPWIEVQAGNYRYLVPDIQTVRIIIGEYIWCQAKWA
jgi:hypothetical protein